MAAGVTAVVDHGIDATDSDNRTVSITHAGGGPLLVFVSWRQTSDIAISSITYDGAAMTLVDTTGFLTSSQGSCYRLNDPGAKTANLAITWAADVTATGIASCRGTDVSASGYIDSSDALTGSTTSLDVTYSRVSASTISLHYTFRPTGATPRTCSPDDGQTEHFDVDGGNGALGHSFYSLVETASGSLTRSATWTLTGVYGAIGVSLATVEDVAVPAPRPRRQPPAPKRRLPAGDRHVAAAAADSGLAQAHAPVAPKRASRTRVIRPILQPVALGESGADSTGAQTPPHCVRKPNAAPRRVIRPAVRSVEMGESGPDSTGTQTPAPDMSWLAAAAAHRRRKNDRIRRRVMRAQSPETPVDPPPATDDMAWRAFVRPSWPGYRSPRFLPPADGLIDQAAAGGDLPITETPGAYDRQPGDVDLTIPYPPVSSAESLVDILTVGHLSSATQASATYTFPGGWELLFLDTSSSARHWTYRRIPTGAETGSITVSVSGGIAGGTHSGVIRRFSLADPTTIEGAAVSAGTGVTVTDAGVTTTGANRLALQLGFFGPARVLSDFTGETGGDWSIASQGASASAKLWLQTAAAPVATTINGGTLTIDGTGAWLVRGFALVRAAATEPEPETVDTGRGGGGGGSQLGVRARRKIHEAVERAWRKKYGRRANQPPPAIIESAVKAEVAALPPQPAAPDYGQLLDRLSAILDAVAADMRAAEAAELDAEESALLVVLSLI